MLKQFPLLFKYTNRGQPQQWQIFVNKDEFYTEEGIVGGVLTKSLPTKCFPKNAGKSNATTAEQQSIIEAKAKYQKKLDKGYSTKLESSGAKFLEPMLAYEYSKYPIDFTKEVVYGQPKLDGLRCINDGKSLTSRNGKPYVACPHLIHKYDVALDGELYTHKYKDDFNKIVSLCKKQKPTVEDLKESEQKIEYWVYDYPSHNATFSERYKALTEIKDLPKGVVIVPTMLISSQEELEAFHLTNIEAGFEGTIIRRDAPYEFKRSKSLLKYKDFIDEEFEILEAREGEGGRAGTLGFFWMLLEKGKPYRIDDTNDSKCINVFKSNVKGDFDFLKNLWENQEKYIGKDATVKYFNRTPLKEDGTGNKPRFPYIIKINRQEYE